MEKLEEKAKRLEAEYHKKWRAKNPDKVKEINKRYWLKKAKEMTNNKEEE